MILDRFNRFSDEQDLGSLAVGSVASTDVVDLGAAGDAIGKEMYLLVRVKEAFTSAGSATVNFILQTDALAAFGSPKVLWQSGALAKATLVDDYRVALIRIPQGCEAVLRMYYTAAVADLTAGKVDAHLVAGPQENDFTA